MSSYSSSEIALCAKNGIEKDYILGVRITDSLPADVLSSLSSVASDPSLQPGEGMEEGSAMLPSRYVDRHVLPVGSWCNRKGMQF